MQGSGPDSEASKTSKAMMANLSLNSLQTSIMGYSSQHLIPSTTYTVCPVLFIHDLIEFSVQPCTVCMTIRGGDFNNVAGVANGGARI